MNALELLKRGILDGFKITQLQEVWNFEIPQKAWSKIVKKLGIDNTPMDVRRCTEGKDLIVLMDGIEELLQLKSKFNGESKIGSKFLKDIVPHDFPWSNLKILRDSLDAQLWHRRQTVLEALYLVAKDEVIKEQREAEEKAHLQNVPEMEQSSKRKTLAWHRKQAKKEVEKNGKEKG